MDDLISRAAAIKTFTSKPPEYYHTGYIASELRCLPTIDAAPVVHGWWIEKQAKYHGKSRASFCSKCGATGRKSWIACPHCGAKMDGEVTT